MKFVDKQLAIKLKEKGFDKPCFGYYKEKEDKLNLYDVTGNVYSCLKTFGMHYIINAPTIDQVLEWLREEKSLHIVADFEENMKWFFQIAKYYTPNYEYCKYGFNTYEDACIAGIEYVINNLI